MTFSENDGNHVRFCILINRVSVRMEPIIDHHSLTSKKMNNSNKKEEGSIELSSFCYINIFDICRLFIFRTEYM